MINPEQQGFLAADQQWVPVSDQQRVPDLQGCLPADQQGGAGQWGGSLSKGVCFLASDQQGVPGQQRVLGQQGVPGC